MRARWIAVFVLLLAGRPVEAQWLNYPTPNIPRAGNNAPDLQAPAPKRADGKPDLSGVWAADCTMLSACWQDSLFFDLARNLPAADVQMTTWAVSVQKLREDRDHVDDPLGYCIPPGVPRITFMTPFKIIATPQVTAFLYEQAIGPLFRQVLSDGRPLPRVTEPAWLGYSIGRWDNDTFVVETTGFPDGGWLDTRKGRPHSDALTVVERYRRTDFGHIDLSVTIDDPKAFLKAWTARARLTLLADTELLQGACENHAKTMEHRRIGTPPNEPPSPRSPAGPQ
jgi:hypothetical protein